MYLLQVVYDETHIRWILCEHKDITQISSSIQEYWDSLLKEVKPLWESDDDDLDFDETITESLALIYTKLHNDGFKLYLFESSIIDICNNEVVLICKQN